MQMTLNLPGPPPGGKAPEWAMVKEGVKVWPHSRPRAGGAPNQIYSPGGTPPPYGQLRQPLDELKIAATKAWS